VAARNFGLAFIHLVPYVGLILGRAAAVMCKSDLATV